eukprot:2549948-Amphidinium_carterae.1
MNGVRLPAVGFQASGSLDHFPVLILEKGLRYRSPRTPTQLQPLPLLDSNKAILTNGYKT